MAMIEFEQYRLDVSAMKDTLFELGAALNVEAAKKEADELEKKTMEADFYSDMEGSKKTLRTIKQLKGKVARFSDLSSRRDDLETLIALALEEDDDSVFEEIKKEYDSLRSDLESTRLETLLTGQYDHNNAIMTLHPGAGGTEAQDWCGMLLRMYQMWAARRGYDVTTLDYLDGDEAGVKSVTISIEGENAYGYAKCEKGIHRLVRMSPFDASGRRHTSFSSVEVMPDIDDEIEININPDDLRIDTFRSSGAGGQHINKTSSAIRITHIPTGIVVSCQNERSQHQNKDMAMKMLRAKLLQIAEEQHKEKIEDIKGVQKDIAWGSQIRSYVFQPYTMVKDHRTNYEVGNISAVMDGDIDGFINEYLKMASLGTLNEK